MRSDWIKIKCQEMSEAIHDWPKPMNLKELRSFLGIGSYYRKYIKGW